ncbi:MAG TPA: hypothetical protein VM165_02960 [Planctomycetaceae bacterium]|nr:hypothetical protein [Planctomycetaceae bacterium]
MDAAIIAAVITGTATVIAAAITLLPRILRKRAVSPLLHQPLRLPEGRNPSGTRIVYYQEAQYRFLNFRGKNCRIEPIDGGQSFLAPTHELFHDPERTRRINRESIVVQP